uniref:Mitochondrial import inner membrane translocase subunit Tim10 B n=1 Tax=Mola mola TaxID=94237 RepID=A0A3Q3VYR3_MOLML
MPRLVIEGYKFLNCPKVSLRRPQKKKQVKRERCVDSCAGKLIRANHRVMGTYVQLMPRMVQRRMEEMESKAAESAKAAEEPRQLPCMGTGGGGGSARA